MSSGVVGVPAPATGGLAARSAAFLAYLDQMLAELQPRPLGELIRQAGGADHVAVVLVDVVNGFCVEGPLAGPRVGAIVPPITRLLRACHEAGVRRFAVLRDSHSPDAPEFEQFGPHCLRGTAEPELVAALAALPFASSFFDVPKNAISAWAGQAGSPNGWRRRQESTRTSPSAIARISASTRRR
jgi:hypothetical protein